MNEFNPKSGEMYILFDYSDVCYNIRYILNSHTETYEYILLVYSNISGNTFSTLGIMLETTYQSKIESTKRIFTCFIKL